MGKLLIEGNAKEYIAARYKRDIVVMGITVLVFAGALLGMGFLFANLFGYETVTTPGWMGIGNSTTSQVRNDDYYWYIGIFTAAAILGPLAIIGWNVIQGIYMGQAKISVYENGIKGAGVGPKYGSSIADTTTVSSFELQYDRVTSADITSKRYITINASGKEYLIAVANPNEIVDTINERLRLAKEAKA